MVKLSIRTWISCDMQGLCFHILPFWNPYGSLGQEGTDLERKTEQSQLQHQQQHATVSRKYHQKKHCGNNESMGNIAEGNHREPC